MPLRFTIRDLLWLTALAAVLVAWWLDHRRLTKQYEDYQRWIMTTLMDRVHSDKTRLTAWGNNPRRVVAG